MSATPPPRRILGLALAGGVVHAAAHIGVLRALDRHDLAPQRIAGSSAGALVGALYAAGVAPAAIQELAREFRWTSLVRPTWRLWEALLDLEPLAARLRQFGLGDFAALRIPFAAVACDLITGRAVTLDRGDVVEALRASLAVPALFPVVERDGCQLVDGGIVDNLPADVARALGTEYLVGVDALPMGQVFPRAGNLLEVFFRSRYLAIRANHPPAAAFDCLIVPRIEAFSLVDLGALDELVARGEEAAEAAMPAIRAGLAAAPDVA